MLGARWSVSGLRSEEKVKGRSVKEEKKGVTD